MEERKSIAKKSMNNVLSISFFVIVLLITWFAHFYNNSLTADIEKLKSNIVKIEWNIKDIKKDRHVQIYSLLEWNKMILHSYSIMNKIPTYINHLNIIQAKYDLKFAWFNLNNWELSSSIEIISDNNGIAFQKTRDFIKNYRLDKKSLFELDFINQIQWMDQMRFNISFKIKD